MLGITNWTKCVAAALIAILFTAFAATLHAEDKPADEKKPPAPKIQMAILLDTSGSMRGLINQARSQLWKVVNEFAGARRGDQQPLVEVALYEYGHASLGAESGFMRQIVPLTDDLDKVSEELFKLEVGGSQEYCGQAIDKAANELKWTEQGRDLHCIFIAGNEPFTQGPVDFRTACKTAADKGITVSTIYCGPSEEGVNTKWLEASQLADGSYMSINQDQVVAAIAAPQDKKLAELSAEINKTYVAYGDTKDRQEAAERQVEQDANAAKAGDASNAARAQFKGSRLYNNARWDLCDACRLGKVKIEDLKDEQLPENLRKMSLEARKEYIENMIQERQKIQDEIKELSDARATFIAEERKKQSINQDDTLDAALIQATRKQAEAKEFKFDK